MILAMERFYKKSAFFIGIAVLTLSGCAMDMRKISVEPKITTENMRKSSLKAGLVFDGKFTSYKYSFATGTRMYMLASIRGEMEIGKNLSQALYGLVSSKFGNVSIGSNAHELQGVDIYFVPRIKSFEFSPPYTGLGSYRATIELETEIFNSDGRLLDRISVKQDGSRSMLNQISMMTTYEMASGTVNEAIDKALKEFTLKIGMLY